VIAQAQAGRQLRCDSIEALVFDFAGVGFDAERQAVFDEGLRKQNVVQ